MDATVIVIVVLFGVLTPVIVVLGSRGIPIDRRLLRYAAAVFFASLLGALLPQTSGSDMVRSMFGGTWQLAWMLICAASALVLVVASFAVRAASAKRAAQLERSESGVAPTLHAPVWLAVLVGAAIPPVIAGLFVAVVRAAIPDQAGQQLIAGIDLSDPNVSMLANRLGSAVYSGAVVALAAVIAASVVTAIAAGLVQWLRRVRSDALYQQNREFRDQRDERIRAGGVGA